MQGNIENELDFPLKTSHWYQIQLERWKPNRRKGVMVFIESRITTDCGAVPLESHSIAMITRIISGGSGSKGIHGKGWMLFSGMIFLHHPIRLLRKVANN